MQADCRGAHVFLEGLVEEKAKEHRIVEGGIPGKALEGELLCVEILQGPMHRLILSPLTIVPDDALGFHQPRQPLVSEPLVDGLTSSEVRAEEGVTPCEITKKLPAFAHLAASRSAVESASRCLSRPQAPRTPVPCACAGIASSPQALQEAP